MKKIIIGLLILIAVIFLGIKGKGLLDKRSTEVKEAPLPMAQEITVRTITPTQGRLAHKVSLLSQVLAQKSIKLSTKLAGYITKVSVEASQHVKKGDPLIAIDSEEIYSSIHALQAALKTQKSDLVLTRQIYARNQKLFEIGGLPEEKLDLSALSVEAKRSTIENTQQKILQLEHQLSYLLIRAPFDAQIDAVLLHEGDLAAAGKPIITLSTAEKKLLVSYAPNSNIHIKRGDSVYLEEKEIGNIKSLYGSASNGLSTAEITLTTNITVPIGSSITVKVKTASAQGCMVPEDTLLHKKEGAYLMGYSEGTFKPLEVDILLATENKAIVSPCPKGSIARGTESLLSSLPAYDHVRVTGVPNAH